MANDYPPNVKLYKNGQPKNFANVMSHTLADDELSGTRGVNLIEQALADGWWWNREGRPDKVMLVLESGAPVVAPVLEPADVAPAFVGAVDTLDPDPVVAVVDVPLDVPESAPRKPRSSKR